MANCKRCGMKMDWGTDGEKFIPLVPIGEDDGLEATFRDENFVLRAVHFLVCKSKAIKLTRLAKPVKKEKAKKEHTDPDSGEITLTEIPLEMA